MSTQVLPTKMSIRTLSKIAILAALGAILMLIDIPVWFAPGFLELDIAEVPSLLATFSLGPIYGFITVVMKNVINLLISGSKTMFVGELSNIIVNGTLVIVAGLIYKRNKTLKQAFIAMFVAVLSMTFIALISNYFFIFPFYAKMYGTTVDSFVKAGMALNPLVHNYLELMLFTVVPFNLIKGFVTMALVAVIYKHVSPILKK